MNRILIIGTTPSVAGIGGVTVHIERLLTSLIEKGIPFDFSDYKQVSLMTILKSILSHKVIHIHASNPYFRLLLILFCKLFNRRVVFTVHGNLGRHTFFKNFFDKQSVRLSDTPILINKGSYNKALKWNKAALLLSAFIPPQSDGYLPGNVSQKVQFAKNIGKTIVVTNASSKSYTSSGREIYGIEFLLNYFKDKEDYFLVISDPSSQYFAEYSESDFINVLFVRGPHSFYALMRMADVMVRATATDGDSISVREGLFLGIKVVVTDCVDRPHGTSLFKYNDASSLDKAIKLATAFVQRDSEDVVQRLVEIYNSFGCNIC